MKLKINWDAMGIGASLACAIHCALLIKIGMTPSHPGSFIKTEILDELGLSVTKAADILGVRRATLSELVNERAALSPANGVAAGKGL